MGRGGRGGGRSPSPNDDRSRSMNPQDVCGQAAMANTARQRGDDDYDDGIFEEAVEVIKGGLPPRYIGPYETLVSIGQDRSARPGSRERLCRSQFGEANVAL